MRRLIAYRVLSRAGAACASTQERQYSSKEKKGEAKVKCSDYNNRKVDALDLLPINDNGQSAKIKAMNAQPDCQQPSTSSAQPPVTSIISTPLSMLAPRLPVGASSAGASSTQSSNYSGTNMYLPTTAASAPPVTTYLPVYAGSSSVPPAYGAPTSTFDVHRSGDARSTYQANVLPNDSRQTLPQNKRRTAISRAVEYLEAVGESVTTIAPFCNYFVLCRLRQ